MPPPRSSNLTSSFSVNDAQNEVVCPLQNQDGSQCRKRCLGEKRYRSMQEHIRRAHPEYYIAKLPATKESFDLMITSPPHERPAQDPNHANHNNHNHHIQHHSDLSGLSPAYLDGGLSSSYQGYHHALGGHDGGYYTNSDAEANAIYSSMQAQREDSYRRGSLIPAASAAAALAQLHYNRGPDSDWGGDHIGQVILPSFVDMSPTNTEADLLQTYYSEQNDMKNHDPIVDPALGDSSFLHDQSSYQSAFDHSQSGMLPNNLATSPPERPATMSSLQRSASRNYNRPRKHSLGQARLPKHERKRSKELAKRISGDKSAASLYGKRWEDLIDAAASATEEEDSRDLTPVPQSPYQSPQVNTRTSLPPPFGQMGGQFHPSFQASPLNRALTPPPGDQAGLDLQHFPSVDSSLSSNLSHQHHNSTDSGSQFQIMNPSSIDSTSSPMFTPGGTQVQIYCAGCKRLTFLKDSYACNQCICGLCGVCTEALISEQSRGRMSSCPHCHAIDSSFKSFQLDLR